MLDKDQYNQEEYNDYYQQEIRGAETSGEEEDDSSKGKRLLLILLGLISLAVAGYFGYKNLTPSDENNSSEEKMALETEINQSKISIRTDSLEVNNEVNNKESNITESQPSATSLKEEKTTQDKVENLTNRVETAISDEQKMSPEEIAKVVQMVMSQMNHKEEKQESITQTENDTALVKDTNLISSLSGTDVDSVKDGDENKKLEESLNKIQETTKDTDIQKDSVDVDTYNKVKVEENSGEDELSKLSSQISSLISDKKTSDQTNNSTEEQTYTESLKKEVVTRKNEMRIIVVRKGDTLGRIAKRAYGNVMEYRKIYKANPDILKRPDRIYIGQKLRIPK
jgi:hypothetical protein